MQEIVYRPVTNTDPESFIYNKIGDYWVEPEALRTYSRAFMKRELKLESSDGKALRSALKMLKLASESGKTTIDDIRAEFAQKEILKLSVEALVNRIRSEVNVTRHYVLSAPSIERSMVAARSLAKQREGLFIDLDIADHKEQLPSPF